MKGRRAETASNRAKRIRHGAISATGSTRGHAVSANAGAGSARGGEGPRVERGARHARPGVRGRGPRRRRRGNRGAALHAGDALRRGAPAGTVGTTVVGRGAGLRPPATARGRCAAVAGARRGPRRTARSARPPVGRLPDPARRRGAPGAAGRRRGHRQDGAGRTRGGATDGRRPRGPRARRRARVAQDTVAGGTARPLRDRGARRGRHTPRIGGRRPAFPVARRGHRDHLLRLREARGRARRARRHLVGPARGGRGASRRGRQRSGGGPPRHRGARGARAARHRHAARWRSATVRRAAHDGDRR